MTIEEFIEKFAFAIEAEPDTLSAATRFKELENWDSLNALSLIAMADAEYEVVLGGQDILVSNTIQDLYDVVNSRIGQS
jgi:acyl carrier protein